MSGHPWDGYQMVCVSCQFVSQKVTLERDCQVFCSRWVAGDCIIDPFLYEKEGTGFSAPYFFKFRCGLWLQPCGFLYEKVASKVTSAEPPGRGNGTDQLGCLTVPGRFHYPSPGAAYHHFQSLVYLQSLLCR